MIRVNTCLIRTKTTTMTKSNSNNDDDDHAEHDDDDEPWQTEIYLPPPSPLLPFLHAE